MKWTKGKLLYIHIAKTASADMVELEEAELVEGKGIVNDRYFTIVYLFNAISECFFYPSDISN